ncbi:MAG: sulfide/dihydroorotate dehydrogenase-like FAD/NAD-binding protein [Anaerolineaceae bacterium]|nr:sulfide/dihydroorotate dehydrogenase-like FAD/NAD-binding protein [Anaerolineaceae bacterium]
MYKILHKEVLSEAVKLFIVAAPLVAGKAKAGQFVIVRVNETAERIPLTIADFNAADGTITLIFQEVGKSTMQMGLLEVGDGFENVVGPLGHPTEIENYGKVVLAAGGVGIAPMFPIVRALKQAGNHITTILGARTRALLFWEERMREYSDELIICTDDCSYGRGGVVTEPLKEILDKSKDIARVWAIGPGIMMKFVSLTTKPYNIPTIVSLNTIMVDGTGMCGGCRVVMDNGAQFVCVDGPEFDGHRVDWDNMMSRLSFYKEDERLSVERWKEHQCNLDKAMNAASR